MLKERTSLRGLDLELLVGISNMEPAFRCAVKASSGFPLKLKKVLMVSGSSVWLFQLLKLEATKTICSCKQNYQVKGSRTKILMPSVIRFP